MLRKTMFLAFAIVVAFSAASSAQCLFGVYGDAEGTQTIITPQREQGNPFFDITVYYVMYVEDFVLAAAWNREFTGFGVVASDPIYDSVNQFLEVTEDGFRIGLGECLVGFNGKPVLIMGEHFTLFDDYSGGTGMIQILPHGSQAVDPPPAVPVDPVYSQCDGNATKVDCPGMGSLIIESVVPVEGQSFGAVKALFK